MSAIVAETLMILFLVLLNGLLSLSEAAMISSRPARLEILARKGSRGAATALRLLQTPSILLSTVQVGITLLGILTGVFTGATLAEELASVFEGISWIGGQAETVAFALLVLVVTYVSLVAGELFPKRIALSRPERMATFAAPVLYLLSRLLMPAVRFFSRSTDALVRIFGVPTGPQHGLNDEELESLLDEGVRSGQFDGVERDMVGRVLRLGDKQARDLMVPRVDVEWIDLDDSVAGIIERLKKCRHSPVPVAEGSLDNVQGFVSARDLLEDALAGRALDIRRHLRPALSVPDSLPALKVLEEFKNHRCHSAVVIDEHGGTMGIVTVGDVAEAVVGEIPSRDHPVTAQISHRSDGSLVLDGGADLDEVLHLLGLDPASVADGGTVHTLGGFVMHRLGRVPVESDCVTIGPFRFQIASMDGNRVDKIVVVQSDTV